MPTDSTESPVARYKRLASLLLLRRLLIPFWHFFGQYEEANSHDLFLQYLNSLIIVTTVRVILVAGIWICIYIRFSPFLRIRALLIVVVYMGLESASFVAAVRAARRRRFWEEG